MDNRTIELRVGIVVAIAAIILFLGIIWIKEYRFNVERYKYGVLFPNVGALGVGDPVTVLGVKKGTVENIILSGGDVLVTFNLTTDVKLKKDAKFTVMNIGLMGERFIDVSPGHSSELLDLSRPVEGFYDTGIPEVMGMAGQMLDEIRRLVAHLEGIFGTEWSQESFKETIKDLRKLSADLVTLLDRNKDKLEKTATDLSYTSSELKVLVERNKEKLQSSVDNFTTSSAKLDTITTTLSSLSISLKNLTQKIESGQGTFGKLVNDSTLYNDLRKTTNNLDELVTDIKKNPKKYLKVSLF
ncbi:MAG: MlaD family protein [candidate division Zixibacteria bacterium]|nr:MlaD family protein [candidate division Zixibacteria bacterium]